MNLARHHPGPLPAVLSAALPGALLDRLRRRSGEAARPGLSMAPALAECLPGGVLPLGVLHEVEPEAGAEVQYGAAVAGFAARLLARIPDTRPGDAKPWLWVAGREDLYAPGLLALGLDPGRLVLACARDDAGVLAAMEAGLRGGAFAAVVGEAGRLSRLAARRLQLACLRHACTGLLLHRWPHGRAAQAVEDAPAAVTRWRIGGVPSGEGPVGGHVSGGRASSGGPFAAPRWRLALLHARGGMPGEWIVEAGERDAPDLVSVVAELADPAIAAQWRRHG